jgi:hypothetical protein
LSQLLRNLASQNRPLKTAHCPPARPKSANCARQKPKCGKNGGAFASVAIRKILPGKRFASNTSRQKRPPGRWSSPSGAGNVMLVKPKRVAGKPSVTNAVKRWNNASRKMDIGDSNDETYGNE